jgi:hypothetical protein
MRDVLEDASPAGADDFDTWTVTAKARATKLATSDALRSAGVLRAS